MNGEFSTSLGLAFRLLMTSLSTFIAYNRVSAFRGDMTSLLAFVANRLVFTITALVAGLFTATTNDFVLAFARDVARLETAIANTTGDKSSSTAMHEFQYIHANKANLLGTVTSNVAGLVAKTTEIILLGFFNRLGFFNGLGLFNGLGFFSRLLRFGLLGTITS